MAYSRQPELVYAPSSEEIEAWDRIATDAQADWGKPWNPDAEVGIVTIRIAPAVYEMLQAMCWELRLPKAELIRAMIMDSIRTHTRSESFLPAERAKEAE